MALPTQQRKLVTEIPGPRSIKLHQQREAAFAAGFGITLPIFVAEAGGGIVVDVDGNHLIDLASGIAVTSVGASHPEVVIELHNVMTEFTRVYRRNHPPLADTLLLYDRWLPGMLRRCHDVMKTCGPAGCSRTRHLMYKDLYK